MKSAGTIASTRHEITLQQFDLDAGMGLQRELAGWAAVPQSDGMRNGVRAGRPQASSGDSHGLLCRDRRVIGTEPRVRGGCDGQDRVRSQGGERAGGAGPLLRPTQRAGDAHRSSVTAATNTILSETTS